MRLAVLAASASLLVAVASFACSSAQPAPKEEPEESEETPGGSSDEEEAPAEQTPRSDAAPTDSGSSDAPTESSVGDQDAGSKCNADSVRESETNNDVASADVVPAVTGTYCGVITSGDVDFMTFTMPNAVDNWGLNIEAISGAGITVEPSADGQSFPFNSSSYPFKPGKPYVLKITGNNGPAEYRIKLTMNL